MDLFKELNTLLEGDGEPSPTQNTTHDSLSFFKSLKYDNKQELTQRDASDIVAQAHEKAEEVDTVAFGLELNDGEIVKVYVNVDDSDAFEQAMSQMLGKEDDVEAAINELAREFDIVSVEWPEDRENQENGGAPESEVDKEVQGNEPTQNPEKENKVKLDFKLNEPEKAEDDKKEDDKKDGDLDMGDGEEEEDGKDKKEDDGLDLGLGGEEEEAGDNAGGEEEASGEEEEDGKPKKSKKKKTKEKEPVKEGMNWAFASFLEEDTKHHHEDTQAIADIFTTIMQRKVIKLILLMGMPAGRMIQFKSQLRHGVREAALHFTSNAKARLFLNRSIKELEDLFGDDAFEKGEKELVKKEDIKEAHDTLTATSVFEHLTVLFALLGVPHDALHIRTSALRQSLRTPIQRILKHGKLRTYLFSLSQALGHKHKKDEEKLDEAVRISNDVWINAVTTVMSELGLPDENLEYRKSNVINSIKETKLKLDLPRVKPRLVALHKLLSDKEEMTNEELELYENEYSRRTKAVKMGEWSISKMSSKVKLSINDFSIEIGGSDLKHLLHSIDSGFETTIKVKDSHFNFKPINHGIEYAVIPLDDEQYAEGILMPKKSVEAFLNLF